MPTSSRVILPHTIFPHIVSTETILFLNLEIQRSQYMRPKVTVHKGAETIQGRKIYEEIRWLLYINPNISTASVLAVDLK